MESNSVLIRQSEVARRLGCSRQNVRQLVAKRVFPSEMVRGVPWVPEEFVLKTIALRERDKKKGVSRVEEG